MTTRAESIANIFKSFLDRYVTPMHLRDNSTARQSEVTTLFEVLLKFAPRENYQKWVSSVLDELEYQMKTRAWPTKAELGAICRDRCENTFLPVADREVSRLCSIEIAAKKMARGEPVAECYVYGRGAVELQRRDLVPVDTLECYREGMFKRAVSCWGQEKAMQWQCEALSRHNAAQ